MAILSNANQSVTLVKSALDAKIALATAEEKENLANAKLALVDLKEMIADLKEENQVLKEQIKRKTEYSLARGVYWSSTDETQEQPFCPSCYSKNKLIPLQKLWSGQAKDQSPWVCPDKGCGADYNPWDHDEPTQSIGVWDL